MFNTLNFVWWNAVLVFVLEFILVAALISPTFTAKQLEIEMGYIAETMGMDTMNEVRADAMSIYQKMFIDTGIYEGSFHLLIPTNQEKKASGAMRIGEFEIFPHVERQLKSLWLGVLQVVVRTVHMTIWLPFILMLSWPFIVDGIYQRKIRFMGFSHASSVRNRWALRAIYLMLFIGALIMLSPFAVPALLFPAIGMVSALAAGFSISNMQKRM